MKNFDSISPHLEKNPSVRPPQIHYQNVQPKNNQVDLLAAAPGKPQRPWLKKVVFFLALIIIILGSLILTRAADLSKKIFAGQTTTFFSKVWEAIRGSTGHLSLRGENNGQINILLLGIGGPGHEGPYLTDTMILAQIRPKDSEVAFISIPRDLVAELPNNLGQRKINAVFAEGLARTQDFGEAGRWSRMAVERLSGQTIPYFAVIDFKGFQKAIDEIKGLDINVEHSFTDSEFPDEKLGYLPPLVFAQGQEHMDGTRALQFARSRHGNNNEGSDFARGLRQQKVMKAFKDKVLEMNMLTSVGRLNNLLGIFADNFHTNLSPGEILRLYDLAKDQNIQTFLSLNFGLETEIICPTSSETLGYILILCETKNSADVYSFFKNAFVLGKLAQEKSVVWLADSGQNPTRMQKWEKQLKLSGLTVWPLEFSKENFAQNIVFQVNPKPATLEYIKNVLNAKEVTLPPPGVKVDANKVDIIVILGKNN